jgi:hypothetical protein
MRIGDDTTTRAVQQAESAQAAREVAPTEQPNAGPAAEPAKPEAPVTDTYDGTTQTGSVMRPADPAMPHVDDAAALDRIYERIESDAPRALPAERRQDR